MRAPGLLIVLQLALAATASAAEVKVYDLPAGSHPHDVAPAPDGTVWYTAQGRGKLGILNPASGRVTEIPLGDGASPHGVIRGPDGAAWITDSGQNAILRVDPATTRIDRWPLPKEGAGANLNTATFDHEGVLWFTGQAGLYGRLDPKSGTIRVFQAPRGPGPYGIATTPSGDVYFASLAGSYIARIDRHGGKAQIIDPPEPEQGARRLWSDSQGNVWVSEWNAGRLARYSPSTGAWRSWPLPGRHPAAYAVYVDQRDVVWVSDFSANATLAFDPRDEHFEAFPGSRDGANVREIQGRLGEVWLPESGNDRLMVIRW